MARVAKAVKGTKSIGIARKPGRMPRTAAGKLAKAKMPVASTRVAAAAAPIEKRKPGRPAKLPGDAFSKSAVIKKAAVRAAAPTTAPKISKDELRAQVERLEQLVASLRSKSRETNKAAKAATARIFELEAQVAQMSERIATPPIQPNFAKAARPKRQGREIDPGDAVPPGVAVREPEPLDEEAESALDNLEQHLGKR